VKANRKQTGVKNNREKANRWLGVYRLNPNPNPNPNLRVKTITLTLGLGLKQQPVNLRWFHCSEKQRVSFIYRLSKEILKDAASKKTLFLASVISLLRSKDQPNKIQDNV
jgi:hypothetical protein